VTTLSGADDEEDAMDSTQSEVSALLDSQADAMRTKDLDRLISLYSPDVAYFDTVPPLQYAGSAALRERFLRWFDGWEGSFEMEIRDIHVLASGDLAVAYRFSRARGTLKDGRKAESWVRATSCFQRSVHGWLITHEHVSWPVDVKTGSAAMDLTP
jgi:ketosteroid isomerase-like protein